MSAGALGVTIRSLFAALAKAATARSISPASRTLTGLNSTPNDGAGAVGIAQGPADVDPHVAAVGPAQLLQPLQERCVAGLPFRIVLDQVREHADAPHPVGLLRPRRERPRGRRAADERDEIAPLHSITSS